MQNSAPKIAELLRGGLRLGCSHKVPAVATGAVPGGCTGPHGSKVTPLRAGCATATPPPSPKTRFWKGFCVFFLVRWVPRCWGWGAEGGGPVPKRCKICGEGVAGSRSGEKINFWGWCRDGDVVVLPARGHGLATHGESEWAAPRRGDKRHSKGR